MLLFDFDLADMPIPPEREASIRLRADLPPSGDLSGGERERLVALYLTGAGRLARLLLDAGDLFETINWSQKVLAIDPCWEEAYRLLMRVHMSNGNRPLAIRAYRQCQQVLSDELGIGPMNETTLLYEQISDDCSD